jgi:pimeloyl-ACP methyl ester carboxylesterase
MRQAVFHYWLPALILGCVKRVIHFWSGLKRREVQVADQRWVYLSGGKGVPIVCVHGFGVDKDCFWTFLLGLSRSYRVIVPDLPGFGESSKSLAARYDIVSQVKRLDAFLEEIGLESFHLLGLSMGGYISGYYASEYPEKVKSLVLIDAAGVTSRTRSEALRRYEEDGEVVLLYNTVKGFDELVSLLFDDPPWTATCFRRYFAIYGDTTYEVHKKVADDILDAGLYLLDDRLSSISAKTLVMWGANDHILDVSSVETLVDGIPDSQSVIIDDCGHLPYIEKPEETKRAHRTFLASLP